MLVLFGDLVDLLRLVGYVIGFWWVFDCWCFGVFVGDWLFDLVC